MKKSKHFRKDVIIARVIFAVGCILIITLVWLGISALLKPQGNYSNPDGQNTQQDEQQDSQNMGNLEDGTDTGTSSEGDSEPEVTLSYVVTSAEVRLRQEPNTDSEILARITANTDLLLLEELEGWYKVEFQGQIGYISAEFATKNR